MAGLQDLVGKGWKAASQLVKQGSEVKDLVCLLKLEEPLKEFKE